MLKKVKVKLSFSLRLLYYSEYELFTLLHNTIQSIINNTFQSANFKFIKICTLYRMKKNRLFSIDYSYIPKKLITHKLYPSK